MFDDKNLLGFKKVIEEIVLSVLNKNGYPTYISAIVTKVNEDGSVDLVLPPDNKRSVHNVLNKSGEILYEGDCVEICTKNGKLSNAWVSLKHGNTTKNGSLEGKIESLNNDLSNTKNDTLIFKKTAENNGFSVGKIYNQDKEVKISAFNIDNLYPVGAIYMSVNNVNPEFLFGGKWEQIQGRFLFACNDVHPAGVTGGEEAHTLTIPEMPSHNHYYDRPKMYFSEAGSGNAIGQESTTGAFSVIAISQNTGGNQPHNNMPPYLSVYMWKRIS